MRKRIGRIFILCGLFLLGASLALLFYNRSEDQRAGQAADVVVAELRSVAEKDTAREDETEEMTTVTIDGYAYVGYLSIPDLNLELPVMAEWDYERLRIAPCLYSSGEHFEELVVAAHNYDRHFGRLKNLTGGEMILFTDMNDNHYFYSVESVETLQPTAVEEMTDSGWDLSLFTCTYGGQYRVTVRASSREAGYFVE